MKQLDIFLKRIFIILSKFDRELTLAVSNGTIFDGENL